jgi:chromosome partitioning protein
VLHLDTDTCCAACEPSRNVRLAEAPSYGVPGVVFDPPSKGAQAFVTFAGEMIERIKAM